MRIWLDFISTEMLDPQKLGPIDLFQLIILTIKNKGFFMAKRPAFQFYASDFISDENVSLMNNRELGCYIRLLCYCWIQGSIPSDIEKLALLAREPTNAMNDIWISIKNCFVVSEDPNRLINPRLKIELEKQIENSKKREEAGRLGGNAKSINNLKSPSNATILLDQNSIIGKNFARAKRSLSISSSTSDIRTIKKVNKEKFDLRFDEFYSAYPRKKSETEAREVWSKNKLDTNADLIINDVVKRRSNDADWGNGFIPYPKNYLKNKLWNDEIIEKELYNAKHKNLSSTERGAVKGSDMLRRYKEKLERERGSQERDIISPENS